MVLDPSTCSLIAEIDLSLNIFFRVLWSSDGLRIGTIGTNAEKGPLGIVGLTSVPPSDPPTPIESSSCPQQLDLTDVLDPEIWQAKSLQVYWVCPTDRAKYIDEHGHYNTFNFCPLHGKDTRISTTLRLADAPLRMQVLV